MKQVIVLLLKKDKQIEKIRKKFLPEYKKFKPHVTLVYPFEIEDQNKLECHIKKAIKKVKPFPLTLEGLKKSEKEYYLYLRVKKGTKEIKSLYKNLNADLLKDFKNTDMPRYIPHLSLGVFKSKKEIDNAIKDIKKEPLSLKTTIKSIQLLKINKDHKLITKKDYKL